MEQFRPFVMSLKRLYGDKKIDAKKVNELFINRKLNREEKDYVLNLEQD